jgi:hypothetical protein
MRLKENMKSSITGALGNAKISNESSGGGPKASPTPFISSTKEQHFKSTRNSPKE